LRGETPQDSFCTNSIRKGALAYLGSVSIGWINNEIPRETMNGIYFYGFSLGEAFAKAWKYPPYYSVAGYIPIQLIYTTALLGDPTIEINPPNKLSKVLCSPDALEICDGQDNNCNGQIDEGCVNRV
jgi:hypothetical protein